MKKEKEAASMPPWLKPELSDGDLFCVSHLGRRDLVSGTCQLPENDEFCLGRSRKGLQKKGDAMILIIMI